jgi:hypothetical protein
MVSTLCDKVKVTLMDDRIIMSSDVSGITQLNAC